MLDMDNLFTTFEYTLETPPERAIDHPNLSKTALVLIQAAAVLELSLGSRVSYLKAVIRLMFGARTAVGRRAGPTPGHDIK